VDKTQFCNLTTRRQNGFDFSDTTMLILTFKKRYILPFALIAFSSCAVRSVYIPVSQNTPLFGSDREVRVVAYTGDNHIELQAAANPMKQCAVAGNVNFGPGFSIYEAAFGTYRYGKDSPWRWEAFAGYGYNTNSAFQTANYNVLLNKAISDYQVKSLYDKYFLQSSLGYFGNMKMYKLNYSFAFSSRFSGEYFKLYSFQELDDKATQASGQPVYIHNIVFKNSSLYLWEPCLTNKIGLRNVSLILQIQAFFPYSEQIDIRNTVFSPGVVVSVGLQYKFLFKKPGNAPSN
jgi:hypothetical protein